jgi:hypothetical protein
MLGDRCSQPLLREKREPAEPRPTHLPSRHWSAMPSEWEVYRGWLQVACKFERSAGWLPHCGLTHSLLRSFEHHGCGFSSTW